MRKPLSGRLVVASKILSFYKMCGAQNNIQILKENSYTYKMFISVMHSEEISLINVKTFSKV
jgi:hypothetical protein